MKRYLFYFIIFSISVGCKSSRNTISSFYPLGTTYLRTDANGLDYFKVFANGSSEKECRVNAKFQLVQQLLYDGFSKGILIKPILATPQIQQKFKTDQENFIRQIIADNTLVNDIKVMELDRLNRESQYQIGVVISINRNKLTYSIKNIINQ